MFYINYVDGKCANEFNQFVKTFFSSVLSIVHDPLVKIITLSGELDNEQKSKIENFYNSLPVLSKLDIAINKLKSDLNEYRDFLASDTFSHNVRGVVHNFDCDDRSAIRLTALVNGAVYHKGAGLPFSQVWRTSGNVNVLLDADDSIALFASGREHESNVIFKCVHIKENLNYSSVEDVENVSVVQLWESTKWPLV